MATTGSFREWISNAWGMLQRNMLRTRFALGLISLAIIMLAMAAYAIRATRNLEGTVSSITTENFDILKLLQDSRLSGSNLLNAVVMYENGQQVRAQNLAERHIIRLEHTLTQFRANPAYLRYQNQSIRFHDSVKQSIDYTKLFLDTTRRQPANDTLHTALAAVVLEMSHNAADLERRFIDGVSITAERSLYQARNTRTYMIVAVILALAGSLYVSWQLILWILQPIGVLANRIQEISQGNYGQQVNIASGDELGRLADSFNSMSAKLKLYTEQTSEKILTLQRTIQKTFASFPHPIFILNSGIDVDYRNPAAERFLKALGYDGNEPVDVFLDRHMEYGIDHDSDYIPESLSDALTFRIGKQERHYLPRVLKLKDSVEHKEMGMAVVLDDITSMRLVDGIKSNLISTVSHEIKNPLTTLRMATHLLLEPNVGTLNDRQADLAEMIRDESERMLETLDDLLELARIDHSDQIINLEVCNVEELVQAVVNENAELAVLRNMTLHTHIDARQENIMADQRVVRHILRNYVSNACKYANEGDILVSATFNDDLSTITFAVEDSGPGIPSEHHEKLFQKFWRIPGEARQGTGLGLAIVKQMAESHGGKVGIRNAAGNGSIFWFELPVETTFQHA